MKKILIVVDYQYDFVTGALPVKDADKIAENIQREINNQKYDSIIYTLDTHISDDYFASDEGKMFPIHCEFNTPGWDFYKIKPRNRELAMIINEGILEEPKDFSINNEFVFMKDKFSIWEGNNSYEQWFLNNFERDTEVTIVGVATDFCVFYNAVGYQKFGYKNINIISDCIKEIDFDESYSKAINTMQALNVNFI